MPLFRTVSGAISSELALPILLYLGTRMFGSHFKIPTRNSYFTHLNDHEKVRMKDVPFIIMSLMSNDTNLDFSYLGKQAAVFQHGVRLHMLQYAKSKSAARDVWQ